MRLIYLGLVIVPVALGGCESLLDNDDVICTSDIRQAIEVEVRDTRDGALLTAGARGVVRDGAYTDSLRPYHSRGIPNGPTLMVTRAAAEERPGTYTVEVEHAGFLPWSRSPVPVARDECHVQTVQLEAWLQPVP